MNSPVSPANELESLISNLNSPRSSDDESQKSSDTTNYHEDFRIHVLQNICLILCGFVLCLYLVPRTYFRSDFNLPQLYENTTSHFFAPATQVDSTTKVEDLFVVETTKIENLHVQPEKPKKTKQEAKKIKRSNNPDYIFDGSKDNHEGYFLPIEVKKSEVSGLGVFAKEFIPNGTRVWRFSSPNFNFNSTHHVRLRKYIKQLSEEEKRYFFNHTYAYDSDVRITNSAADYLNHHFKPNLRVGKNIDQHFALRDIEAGEELFINYFSYDMGPSWYISKVIESDTSCINLLNYFRNSRKMFTTHCRNNILRNETYGKAYAPYVDKVSAKYIVASLNTSVKIPKTYMHFNKTNFTHAILKEAIAKWPVFVVKPNHFSGGIAKVAHKQITCLKSCVFTHPTVVSRNLTMWYKLLKQVNWYLNRKYNNQGQLQYKYIQPQMLLEEYLEFGLENNFVEYGFYVIHGVIIYAQAMCARSQFAYFTSDFVQLDIEDEEPYIPCPKLPERPKNWDEMVKIAQVLGAVIPELIRVDLFTNDVDVYFSELTLTPDACVDNARPKTQDKLLLWMLDHPHLVNRITPDIVKCVINEPMALQRNKE